MAPVTASISRMPGPPRGPSYRMTTTSPGLRVPSVTASIAPCSPSKTRAVPSKMSASKPADFTTAPSGASEPRRIDEPAGLVDRVAHRVDDRAVGVRRGDLGQVLGHGLPGHGERVPVQQAGVQQRPEDDRDAADAVHVGHHEPAERLHVGQERGAVADPVEVLEVQVDLRLVGDRHQVQDGVGRAAERHDHGDRVLERLLGHDLPRGDALAQQVHDGLAGGDGERVAAAVGAGGAALPGSAMPRASATLAMVLAVYMPPQEPWPGQAAFSIAVELVAGDLAGGRRRRRPRRRR